MTGQETPEGSMTGTCTVMLEDAGTDKERVVVVQADDVVYAVPELVRAWLAGETPHVRLDADRETVTFGTEGEGLGLVTYEITSRPSEEDDLPRLNSEPLVYVPPRYVTLRRVRP